VAASDVRATETAYPRADRSDVEASHAAGTVVALGERLKTQFWRLDNGQVRWLTVDLPEIVELRQPLLPDGPRQSSHSGSALDLKWLDGLDP
jgi:O-methyltransferase involved in polyketide biosynthesis